MRWKNKYSPEWRTKFALLPVKIKGYTVWLERYEERYVSIRDQYRYEGWGRDVIGRLERRIRPAQQEGES